MEERAAEFLSYDGIATEMEVLNWLHATVCLLKPANLLETGAAHGLGTLALAAACRDNEQGHVHALEIDPASAARARRRLHDAGLAAWATVHEADSCDWLKQTTLEFGLGFFDSLTLIRVEEFRICLERERLKGPAIFHDTSIWRTQTRTDEPPELQQGYRQQLAAIATDARCGGVWDQNLSRGMFVWWPRSSAGKSPLRET
jgi:predicted O-methyltransferase YrrM